VAERLTAYVQWHDEELEGGRVVPSAWLVCDLPSGLLGGPGGRQVLAYLGQRPVVTATLQEELTALYPQVVFDWPAIRQALQHNPRFTEVASLTDDQLALRLRTLARERGLSLLDLSLRLGYRQRQVMPEVMRFLDDAATVARLERTSGTIFDYMVEYHPEYAFLLYKARLFFEGQTETLQATIGAEPAGFGGTTWQARRRYWREQLEAYQRRRPPPAEPSID
jgi:hypothetical protein